MITPSFGLTATERVLPRLALNFTTAILDSRVTFTRSGNTATVTDSSGVIVAINANLPRFDYNPTTIVCNGLLIEEARTNLLLNSLIDGTSLTTQAIVTTAVSTTLSFYGTGQIVLSGTSSATVVGTGAYPSRKTYTFTPTAGALTLTVTGTVQYAQLEVGAFATSFIPTAATSVIRNADVAKMTGTNFSDWYNASAGSMYFEGVLPAVRAASSYSYGLSIINNTDLTNRTNIGIYSNGSLLGAAIVSRASGSVDVNIFDSVVAANTSIKQVVRLKSNDVLLYRNATLVGSDAACTMPTVNNMYIGTLDGVSTANIFNGWIAKIMYWPQSLTASEIQAFSK